jgi:hypothetical protein
MRVIVKGFNDHSVTCMHSSRTTRTFIMGTSPKHSPTLERINGGQTSGGQSTVAVNRPAVKRRRSIDRRSTAGGQMSCSGSKYMWYGEWWIYNLVSGLSIVYFDKSCLSKSLGKSMSELFLKSGGSCPKIYIIKFLTKIIKFLTPPCQSQRNLLFIHNKIIEIDQTWVSCAFFVEDQIQFLGRLKTFYYSNY